MKTTRLIPIIFVLLFLSCEKDKNETNIQVDKIKLGNYSNMIVHNYDTMLVGGYHNFKFIDLDIDGDSVFDVRFTSEIWGSPGLGQHPQSKVYCLNTKCLVKSNLTNDTTFINFQTDTSYGENWSPVYIYNTTIYSCEKISELDSIIKIQPNEFKMEYLVSDDLINKSDIFTADTFTLSDEWYSALNYPLILNDTIINNYVHYHNTCNSFPSDQIMFLGIKIGNLDNEKLGWIKLGFIDNYKVLILETALHK
jgi:hypothetical protein